MTSKIKPLGCEGELSKSKKWGWGKVIVNGFYLTMIALYLVTAYIVVANFDNVRFSIENPDYMEAVKRVKSQEIKKIQEMTKSIKDQARKQMLSPLVTNSK